MEFEERIKKLYEEIETSQRYQTFRELSIPDQVQVIQYGSFVAKQKAHGFN
jgi:hypothetical protein